jgi:hypothetical protein
MDHKKKKKSDVFCQLKKKTLLQRGFQFIFFHLTDAEFVLNAHRYFRFQQKVHSQTRQSEPKLSGLYRLNKRLFLLV